MSTARKAFNEKLFNMSIIQLPKTKILHLENDFLSNQNTELLIKLCLECCYHNETPKQKNDILNSAISKKDIDFTKIYDFIINQIEYSPKETPKEITYPSEIIEEDQKNLVDQLSNSGFSEIKNGYLLSYLYFPYLGQFNIFKNACINIQKHLNHLDFIKPKSTIQKYSSKELNQFFKQLAYYLFKHWETSTKKKLVLLGFAFDRFINNDLNSNLELSEIDLKDFCELENITDNEASALGWHNYEYLFTKNIYKNLEGNALKVQELHREYFLNILNELGLIEDYSSRPSKHNLIFKFSKNYKKLVSYQNIYFDFDPILCFFDDFHYSLTLDCGLEDEFQLDNKTTLLNNKFYAVLQKATKESDTTISLSDYKSQLVIKVDLCGETDFFTGATSTPGHVLSLFEEHTGNTDFVAIYPYAWQFRETELDDLIPKRSDLFIQSIQCLLNNNHQNLAQSYFIIATLGELSFLIEDVLESNQTLDYTILIDDYLNIANTILTSDKTNQKELIDTIAYFKNIFKEKCSLKSFSQKEESLALLNNFLSKHAPSADIKPLLAPLPFELSDIIKNKLDKYSLELLETIQWRYNDYLAIKNASHLNLASDPFNPSRVQNFLQSPCLLIEHNAKKFVKQHLRNNYLGNSLIELHKDDKIIKSPYYQNLLNDTGQSTEFFKEELGKIRNWANHAIKSHEHGKYSINDYSLLVKNILPSLLRFFYTYN